MDRAVPPLSESPWPISNRAMRTFDEVADEYARRNPDEPRFSGQVARRIEMDALAKLRVLLADEATD